MSNKVRIVIFFVCLAFAVYFGIGMVNSWNEYNVAVQEADIAQQELDDATADLAQAEKELRELTSGS